MTEQVALTVVEGGLPQVAAPAKEFDVELVERTLVFLTKEGMTQGRFAKMVGCSTPTFNRWLKGAPEGKVKELESKVADVLLNLTVRRELGVEYCVSHTSTAMRLVFEAAREMNVMGGFFAPGGAGKTCGLDAYRRENPTAVRISVEAQDGGSSAMVRKFFAQIETRRWRTFGLSRADYLTMKFKGSNRLVLVDEAHLLKKGGRNYFRTFHDTTKCPVVFVGNEKFLEDIKDDEQMSSRVLYCPPFKFKAEAAVARWIVDQYAPGKFAEIVDLAMAVFEKPGHGRSLQLQTVLAAKMEGQLIKGKKLGFREAFRAAHTQMIRHYALPEDQTLEDQQ